MTIAIMCSGGDCAGMNPAIKSFVDYSYEKGITPYFIYEGFEGLIDGKIKKAKHENVAGIIHLGGTIIKTSRSKRFYEKKYREQAYDNLQKHNINKIVVLGGNGSFEGLNVFSKEYDISFVGVPSTIDNDIYSSDYSLGVDTSLNIIKSALDDIRDTSSSFKRAFVVETMGRDSGYLAIVSAITSGAEICVVPEIEVDFNSLEKRLKKELKNGRSYILAIVAEGTNKTDTLAKWIEEKLDIETRTVSLGHIQRGGNPSVFDRLMANEFVTLSIDKLLTENTKSVIIYKNSSFQYKQIEELSDKTPTINPFLLKQLEKMIK
ncbi:6-phosphofructokinase [Poseidonibacter sp.]|uniref:6-phosphofructokinase n=1 Tax=Poseidonibacter sp. TaxID=2321188 RepID=UPI003C762080